MALTKIYVVHKATVFFYLHSSCCYNHYGVAPTAIVVIAATAVGVFSVVADTAVGVKSIVTATAIGFVGVVNVASVAVATDVGVVSFVAST